MDELVIEDKKYISTRRAAQDTGYAKDYIGQLCREGRVPARLVGRSWYVLESAIQDHRFDSSIKEIEHISAPDEEKRPLLSSAWESPRYEAMPFDILPSVNRLKESFSASRDDNPSYSLDKIEKQIQTIHEVWSEWFAQVKNNPKEDPAATTAQEETAKPQENAFEPDDQEREVAPTITIHTLVQREREHKVNHRPERAHPRKSSTMVRISAYAFVLLALLFASSAVVSSGVLDDRPNSLEQASIITGVSIYKNIK